MRAAVATVGAKSWLVAAARRDSSCRPAVELDRLQAEREKGSYQGCLQLEDRD